jgi:hypothetical protein
VALGRLRRGARAEGAGRRRAAAAEEGQDADEQLQGALPDDADPDWAQALVERVVEGMSGSDFPATVNEHCARSCAVRASCPAWPEGQGVVR